MAYLHVEGFMEHDGLIVNGDSQNKVENSLLKDEEAELPT